jgi:hypothetical protein
MTKAKQFSVGMAEYFSGKHHNSASPTNAGNEDITHTLPHNKMYVIIWLIVTAHLNLGYPRRTSTAACVHHGANSIVS